MGQLLSRKRGNIKKQLQEGNQEGRHQPTRMKKPSFAHFPCDASGAFIWLFPLDRCQKWRETENETREKCEGEAGLARGRVGAASCGSAEGESTSGSAGVGTPRGMTSSLESPKREANLR